MGDPVSTDRLLSSPTLGSTSVLPPRESIPSSRKSSVLPIIARDSQADIDAYLVDASLATRETRFRSEDPTLRADLPKRLGLLVPTVSLRELRAVRVLVPNLDLDRVPTPRSLHPARSSLLLPAPPALPALPRLPLPPLGQSRPLLRRLGRKQDRWSLHLPTPPLLPLPLRQPRRFRLHGRRPRLPRARVLVPVPLA
jgi:hypothetical protein